MQMKHIYIKERSNTLWRVKDQTCYKGKHVYLLEDEVYDGSTYVIVDEDLNIVLKYAYNGLIDLEGDIVYMDEEGYSEMEKARDRICQFCGETRCLGCKVTEVMDEARGMLKSSDDSDSPEPPATKHRDGIKLADLSKAVSRLTISYGDLALCGMGRCHFPDEPNVDLFIRTKDDEGKERDFLLVETEHGIFPVLMKDNYRKW